MIESKQHNSSTSIIDFFHDDHARLDRLFEQFQTLRESDFNRAKSFFREFIVGLAWHMAWEEEYLFPVFEEKTGIRENGPTAVMKSEHISIKNALEKLHDKVRARDQHMAEEEELFLVLLKGHNAKEEQIFYPSIEQLTNEEEKREILKRIHSHKDVELPSCCNTTLG